MTAVQFAPYLTVAGALLPKPAGWLLYAPGILFWWLTCAWKALTLLFYFKFGGRLSAEKRRSFVRTSAPGVIVLLGVVAGLVTGRLDWAACAVGVDSVLDVWKGGTWRPRQALDVLAAMLVILAASCADAWLALGSALTMLVSRVVREPLSRVVASKPSVADHLRIQQEACEGGG